MGIVNITPDSFSRDGQLLLSHKPADHARYARALIKQGADVLDLGAESSRPGARRIAVAEETRRLVPLLRLLVPRCPVPISVDTYKPQVAQAALDQGASMINLIMGVSPDKHLLTMVRNYHAAIVLMHMRGTPRTMQRKTRYRDVIKSITEELKTSIEFCLEIGIKKDKIIVDPGIGFAKTAEQNLQLINHLSGLQQLQFPILVGPSRKSFIGKVLEQEVDAREAREARLWGTAASVAMAIVRGANIIRVHDVGPMKQIARMTDAIIHSGSR